MNCVCISSSIYIYDKEFGFVFQDFEGTEVAELKVAWKQNRSARKRSRRFRGGMISVVRYRAIVAPLIAIGINDLPEPGLTDNLSTLLIR